MAEVTLRLFASAREAAGTGSTTVAGSTVGDALEAAERRFGDGFAQVLSGSRCWLNGEPTDQDAVLNEGDELAVLPPVSGG